MPYQGSASFDTLAPPAATIGESGTAAGGATLSSLVTFDGHPRSLRLVEPADTFASWGYNPGGATQFSLSFWFTTDGLPSSTTQFFGSNVFGLFLGPSGLLSIGGADIPGTNIIPGVWYWFESSINGLYLDGVQFVAGDERCDTNHKVSGIGGIPMYYSDFVAWLDGGTPNLKGHQTVAPRACLAIVKGYGTYNEFNWQPTVIGGSTRNPITGSGASVTYTAGPPGTMTDTSKNGVYGVNDAAIVGKFIENAANATNGIIASNTSTPFTVTLTAAWSVGTPTAGDAYQIAATWEQLTEKPPDGSGATDVTYMEGGTVGARATFKLQSDSDLGIPASSVPDGALISVWCHGQGSKTNNLDVMFRMGGTDYTSAANVLASTSYAWVPWREYFDVTRVWTLAELASWEAGVRADTGNTGLMTISAIYVAFSNTPPSNPSKPTIRPFPASWIVPTNQPVFNPQRVVPY